MVAGGDVAFEAMISRRTRMNLPHSCMNLYELSCPALYQCLSPLCDGGEAYGGGALWMSLDRPHP